MTDTLRLCTKCGQFKPHEAFSKRKASPDGMNHYCKECMARYYSDSRAHAKVRGRKYNRRPDVQARMRAHHLQKMYDMTMEEYEAMVIAQGGLCAVCGMATELVVDHDHDTGKVRGLLCRPCNSAVTGGVDWARKVVAYLEKANDLNTH
jgi:hypothetical protein